MSIHNLLADTHTQTIDLPAPAGISGITIEGLIQFALIAVVAIAGIIFFFMLIFGGIRWIMSGGDKTGTEAARSQITAALVGLIIVFSAWAIATLIEQVFGVDILNFKIESIKSLSNVPE